MDVEALAGLGNPGPEYAGTRHNLGRWLLDQYAIWRGAESWRKKRRLKSEAALLRAEQGAVLLLKPLTFMNGSGEAIQKAASHYKIPAERWLVVYDDFTLPPARIKLSRGGSGGGHNGIADIVARIGPDFARLRVGLGQKPQPGMALTDYVLGKLTADEQARLDACLPDYLKALDLILSEGVEAAMNTINRKPSA